MVETILQVLLALTAIPCLILMWMTLYLELKRQWKERK